MTSGEGQIVACLLCVSRPPLVDNSDGEIGGSDADQIFSTRQKGGAACGRETDGPLHCHRGMNVNVMYNQESMDQVSCVVI